MSLSKSHKEFIKIEVLKLRKKLNLKNKHQLIVKDLIIQHFGHMCKIKYVDLPVDADIVTYYHPQKKVCVMMVNRQRALMYPKRLNFSLAHELGHLMLKHHENFMNKAGMAPQELEMLEKQADEFAGQLLVNEYILERHKKARNALLSDYFFVSEEVIRIRKEALGVYSAKNRQIL